MKKLIKIIITTSIITISGGCSKNNTNNPNDNNIKQNYGTLIWSVGENEKSIVQLQLDSPKGKRTIAKEIQGIEYNYTLEYEILGDSIITKMKKNNELIARIPTTTGNDKHIFNDNWLHLEYRSIDN